jgi:DNA-directed RNA polymerase subunit omega
MMMHPSYKDIMDAVNKDVEPGEESIVNSRYSICIATAKRAKQLIAGADPKDLDKKIVCDKPLSQAVEELYEGKIKILPKNAEDNQ